MRKARWLGTAGILVALHLGCTPSKTEDSQKDKAPKPEAVDELLAGLSPAEAAKTVAKVGDIDITVGDVTSQINRMSPFVRQRYNSPEKKREFVERLVRAELLALEARKRGIEKDPEVEWAVDQAMIRIFTKNELEKKVLPVEVADSDVKAYYETHQNEFNKPGQVRVSMILVKAKAEAQTLLRQIQAKADDPKLFRELARQHSIDEASKARGGDLRYVSKPGEDQGEPKVDEAILNAAWSLKNVGDVHPEPVETAGGFAIVKITNRKEALTRDLESVRRIIENRLLKEKRREAMDRYVKTLKDKAKIKVYDQSLELVRVKVPEHGHPQDAPRPPVPPRPPVSPRSAP